MKDYLLKGKYWEMLRPEERRLYFNGCGPDWFPEKYRHKLDKFLHLFKECFDIHDLGYGLGETWEEKEEIDEEFYANMKAVCFNEILMKDLFNWRTWKEYFKWSARAKACYLAVKHGGGAAFWYEEKLIRLGLNEAPEPLYIKN
jgi:hypothetical protein